MSLIKIFLCISFILLPFSTSPDDGFVFSFGIPFFTFFVFLSTFFLMKSTARDYHYSLIFPILVLFFIMFSTWISPTIYQSSARLFINIIGFSIFIAIYICIGRKIISEKFVLFNIIIFGVVLSVYYILNIMMASFKYGFSAVILERWTGGLSSLPWGASNVISAVLVFSVATTLVMFDRSRQKIYIFFLIIISTGILATLSRTGIIILVLFLLFYVISEKKKSILFVLFIFIFCSFLLALFYAWDIIWNDSYEIILADRFSNENVFSAGGRVTIWVEKLEFFLENVLNPIGYYGSLHVFDGITAHNFFITVLLEQSFLGLMANALFLFYPFVIYISHRKKYFKSGYKWYFYGLFIVIINLFIEDSNFTQQYILTFWVYMALIYSSIPHMYQMDT